MSRERTSTLRALALLILAVGGASLLRADAMRGYLAGETYEDIYYLPPPTWLRVFSLGHEEALADLVWMRALVYFGQELTNRGDVSHVFDYGNAIVTLDPHFPAAYRWVGTSALYRTGEITARDGQRAVAFLERGVRQYPDDAEMLWQLGATLSYELPPLLADDAAKREAKRRGIPYLEAAARRGGGPPWLVLTNASQLERLGRTEQAIRHLEEMYATVRDDDTRQQIALHLARLRSAAYAEAFEAAQRDLDARRWRDAAYLAPTLFLLTEPWPAPEKRARWQHDWFLESQELVEDDADAHDDAQADADDGAQADADDGAQADADGDARGDADDEAR